MARKVRIKVERSTEATLTIEVERLRKETKALQMRIHTLQKDLEYQIALVHSYQKQTKVKQQIMTTVTLSDNTSGAMPGYYYYTCT